MNKFYRNYEALSYDDVLLVPRYSDVDSRLDTDLTVKWVRHSRYNQFPHTSDPDKLYKYHRFPIMSASMDTVTDVEMAQVLGREGCVGVIHRYQSLEDRIEKAREVKFGDVGIAIGLHDDIQYIYDNACSSTILSVDVAHAHTRAVIEYVKQLRSASKHFKIMVGNIATKEAALDFAMLDVDYIKIGVGPGACCSTREVTGCGFPMISAIMEVRQALESSITLKTAGKSIPMVVADGGIRTSGDIAKALAAGATMVMVGSLFAGTDEAPTYLVEGEDGWYKEYRGMASIEAQAERGGLKPGTVPEGVSTLVPYKGPVGNIVQDLIGGLRSALPYQGARNLQEFYENSQFIKVSPLVLTAETKVR